MAQTSLTALERELLGYVERLVKTSETSANELRGLEQRSTDLMTQRLDLLTACMARLLRSQMSLAAALSGLLNDAENYEALEQKLHESLRLAKDAERRLK